MLVELRKLEPNPWRNFALDPIDAEQVAGLRESIREDGFWGGVVCRLTPDGRLQIAAGHHRIEAARAEGIEEADVFVARDMDDAHMIRIYTRENSTQRGNNGTAQVGSVSAAIRYLAKRILLGDPDLLLNLREGRPDGSKWSIEQLHAHFLGDYGIGSTIIMAFLHGIENVNLTWVTDALTNLKSSGIYDRIVADVGAEVEREQAENLAALEAKEREEERLRQEEEEARQRERKAEAERKAAADRVKAARDEAAKQAAREAKRRAREEAERAKEEARLATQKRKEAEEEAARAFGALRETRATAAKAKEGAAKRPVTFDFEGVARHLKNPYQVRVFRECVTGPGIAPFLPVDRQAALAEEIAGAALPDPATGKGGDRLSGTFIRSYIGAKLQSERQKARHAGDAERRRVEERELATKAVNIQRDVIEGLRKFLRASVRLAEVAKSWPSELTFPADPDLARVIADASVAINDLHDNINKRLNCG